MDHFADRLLAACDDKGAPVCVGLDPVLARLPEELRDLPPDEAIQRYCADVLTAVAPHVPCVKPQLACFERYGSAGYAAYEHVVDHARSLGLIVIADGKRGDIGASSDHYAAGLLAADHPADALTVNAYLGIDGLDPFIDTAARHARGLFALVRTSNPGGDALQSMPLADGRTVAEGVADLIARAGQSHVGERGYSLLGAVVGATKPADAAALRKRMPKQLFLVPGFGAQGGTADDVRACFNPDAAGAIITASRSVIYAYEMAAGDDWRRAIADAARDLRDQIARILAH